MKECMISCISISISKISVFLTSTYYIHNKLLASNDDFGLLKMYIRNSIPGGLS
jgi:hypothetical protein